MGSTNLELQIDPSRVEEYADLTGIYIRAKDPINDKWGTYDLGQLDRKSFLLWLMQELNRPIDVLTHVFNHQV